MSEIIVPGQPMAQPTFPATQVNVTTQELAQKILEIAKRGLADLEGDGGASGAGFQEYEEIIALCQEEANKQ